MRKYIEGQFKSNEDISQRFWCQSDVRLKGGAVCVKHKYSIIWIISPGAYFQKEGSGSHICP